MTNSTTKHEVEQEVKDLSGDKHDHDNDDERIMPREKAKKRASYCPDVFGRVICDEAEHLKNLNTHSHISVARLRATILKFLTATPMTKKNDIPEAREFGFLANWGLTTS